MSRSDFLSSMSLNDQIAFVEQKSNDTHLEFLWERYLRVNARYSEVDGQIQSKRESQVSNGNNTVLVR
jgi:hypothetical protein